MPAGCATADSAARAGALSSSAELFEARNSHAGSPCTSPVCSYNSCAVVTVVAVVAVAVFAGVVTATVAAVAVVGVAASITTLPPSPRTGFGGVGVAAEAVALAVAVEAVALAVAAGACPVAAAAAACMRSCSCLFRSARLA